MRKVPVMSLCGAANLIAAVFGRDPNAVKRKLGLPLKGKFCVGCGKQLWKPNTTGFCQKCRGKSSWTTVICDECGIEFKRRTCDLVYRLGKAGANHVWCSKQCQGRWLGKHHKASGRPRKYDYAEVMKLKKAGYRNCAISRMTGVPQDSVAKIICKERNDGAII